jgi:hypothetical protein
MQTWFPTRHTELPLDGIGQYPGLAAALEVWRAAPGHPLPQRIDPTAVPRNLLPYVMLLGLEREPDVLRVRLAGTFVCRKYGGELKGRTTDDFFDPEDARIVLESSLAVAASGRPSLARREYVSLEKRIWRYVRLIAPMSFAGDGTVDGFFKLLDPDTLEGRAP